MKKTIASFVLCLAQGLTAGTLDLNGEWRLDYFSQPEPEAVRSIPLGVAHETVTATVPGCCELDLVRAGKLPAPEVGLNATRFRAYEGHQWLYSRKFTAARPTGAGRASLVFDGIDTLADVFLNGQKVGEAANMLVPHRFDVTSVLRDGENEVAVLIRSAILEARGQTVGELGRRHACGGGDDERIRKAAYMGGWDIFPRLYVSGIWRGVRLETDAGERIDQPAWIVTELDPTNRTAMLTVQCRVRAPFDRLNACRLRYTVSRAGRTLFRTERPFVVFQNNLEFQPVRGFELWWPRGWGEQPLYDAAIELVDETDRVLAESRSRIGFRSIRLEYADNRGKDRPGQFLFRVNGEPCYVRGTNWVPPDAIPSRGEQFLESTLALCADLNCNMIRVWGGGVYESDRFYDRCDELGFMVWQDFMTGCQPSPQDDDYATVTRDEALKTVLRLRNHPSIALWSGNNEIDWSYEWHACDGHRRRNPNDDRSSRKTIPNVLFEYDVTRDYLPSSPYFSPEVAGGLARPAEEHLWGERGAYKVPYYTNAPCHFASEMGYHGCPGVASLKRMMTPSCVFPWTNPDAKDPADLAWNREWQLKAANPYDTPDAYQHPKRNALMTNQCRLMFGEVPRTLEDFVAASQIVQAEALKTFVELFRSRKFTRMNGLVWWNVRDGWPQISDAVVDYYGAAKLAYAAIRTAQQDQIVCVLDDHSVWAVNDALAPAPGEVTLTDAASGKVLMTRTFEIPANGKLDLGRVPFSGQGCIRIAARFGGRAFKSHFLYGEPPFRLPRVREWLEDKPLVIVNCDNDHFFKACSLAGELPAEERFSEAGLRKYIDLIARGGRVTHVFMCAVGQRANYDSKICDPIWMALDEAKERAADAMAQNEQVSLGLEWPRNVKRLYDLGIDPYKVWTDYCRSSGKVRFWLSQRMNDIHNSDMKWNIRTSRFWYDHPELRRKDKIDHTWKDGSGWPDLAFDYSKPEVREYEFAVFKELVDRYDADGFELDFMRWWQNLSPRKGREQAPILTAFIARCRRYLDGLEKTRGHRIGLAARCASSYKVARELGMDVEAWAREGLVDIVAVANFFAAADFDCDLAGWKRRIAAANPRVKVVASACDNVGCADEVVTFTPEAVRGFADIAARAGVDGFYFFNYAWFTRACRDVFRDEDLMARPRGGRRYPCSYHDCTADDDAMKCRQLPVAAGQPAVLRLNVGSPAGEGEDVSVVVGYDNAVAALRVALNGVAALSAEPVASVPCATDLDISTGSRQIYGKEVTCAFRCRFPASALKAGHNEVSVSSVDAARLIWAEIDVGTSAGAEPAGRPVSVQLDLRQMSGKSLDGYLAEVRRTGAESVQLVLCEFFEEGEARQRLLAQLKEAIAFFERAGYPVWVWTSTLGYGDDGPPERIRRTKGFRRMAGFDGKPTCGAMCALDPQVAACLRENIRDFARAGAKTILLDDEFVQARRENLHCFCPDHLRLMSEKAGRPVTGEDVRKSLCGAPNPVRTAYLDAMGESLLALAKALRAAADEVDPSVRIGLCASFNSYDAEGGDEGLLARTLAGRGNRPLLRLSGASYWINCAWGPHYPGQDLGGVLEFLRMQIAWYGKSGFAVMDENDPYPRDSKVIPAEVVELYDMLTTASGIGIRDKYVLRESPACDPAYRRAHAANAAENARIAALFEGRTACGWSVFAPEHQLREARMPETYEGPCRFLFRCTHPRAGIFLSLAGAATAYGSDEGPFAAFGATAALLPREKLSRGLLTDEEGAAALEQAGVRLSAAERTDGPFALRRTADGAPVAVVGWKEDFSRRSDHPLFADEGFRDALERTHRFLSGRPPVVSVRGASGVYALAAKGDDGSLAVLLANVLSVPTPPFTVRINGRAQTVPGLPPYSWRTIGPERADRPPAPWHLTCERVVEPTAVDVARPRLSWRLPDGVKAQTAYEIEADGWSSGRVASPESVDVPWGGGPIASSACVTWRVRIWDENGKASDWSDRTRFVAGVTDADGWKGARWIGGAPETRPEVDFGAAKWVEGRTLEKSFDYAGAGICDFAVFATEPYRLYLNGEPFMECFGHVYDFRFVKFWNLTDRLKKGRNDLRIVLRDKGRPAELKLSADAGVPAVLGVVRLPDGGRVETDRSWGGRELGGARGPAFAKGLVCYEERWSPAFAKRFRVDGAVRRAVLHVTGLGFYEAFVNGTKVGDKVIDPSPTDYEDRVLYSTYELGRELKTGENELRILLGHGWYDMRSLAHWNFETAPWRGIPRTRARLTVEYADGRVDDIVTDGTWDQVESPIVYDCIREGEVLGARPAGEPPLPSGLKAACVEAPRGRLQGETMPGSKVVETLRPERIVDCGGGRCIVTFPREVAGWAKIDFRGLAAGDVVTVRYDEKLKPDGRVTDPRRPCPDWDWNANDRMIDMYFVHSGSYRHVSGGDMQIDHFTSAGLPCETHEPRFVWHGFRHLVVDGLKAPLRPEDVSAQVVRTAFPVVGSFSCSDETLTRLVTLAENSYAANFTAGYPTDCPTREKLGWTGDAWIASEMAQYFFENTAAYEKWYGDVLGTQREPGDVCGIAPTSGWGYAWGNGPVFDAVLAMLPWNLWTYRGDRAALDRAYGPLKRYLAYEQSLETSPDLVSNGLDDWNAKVESRKPSSELVISCIYLRLREIAAEIARVKGLAAEADGFAAAAARTRRALRAKYVNADGTVDNGGQTAQALAVFFGLYADAAEKARIGEKLVRAVEVTGRHIDFGLVGAKYVYRALTEAGRPDLAYRMIVNPSEPSMAKWLGPEGTGCLWEDFGKGLSKCHIMLGDFSAWCQQTLAGIRPAAPGFRAILFEPKPVDGIRWAKGSTESPYGRIASDWKLGDDDVFTLTVEVPAGCTATVVLPDGSRRAAAPGRATFSCPFSRVKWISPATDGARLATAEFRRTFANRRAVRRATWTTSGLGVYEACVNGTAVSGFLEPGFTDVLKCRHAFVHDVTAAIRREAGALNELSATVSAGWWTDMIERGNYWVRRSDRPGADRFRPAFRGELTLTYEDGSTERIPTDGRWQAAWGAETVEAGIYEGEVVDLRRRGRAAFGPAVENADFGGEIRPARNVPAALRRDLTLAARAAWVWRGADGAAGTNVFGTAHVVRRPDVRGAMTLEPGETLVVDFGQNAAFVPETELDGASGARVVMLPGEMLNDGDGRADRGNDGPGGSVHRANYRAAPSRADVTLAGGGPARYVPRFTFFGGRYLSITSSAPVTVRSLVAVPVTSIRREDERGTLAVGNPLVDRLVRNVEWGMYSNYLSVPTDCPQRDERLGWTADADVFAKTATYRADVKDFLAKYLADLRDGVDANGVYPVVGPVAFIGPQGHKFGWTDAGVLITHKLWWRYGDREIVDENWAAMERYVRFVDSFGGKTVFGKGWQYADWLSFEGYEAHADGKRDPKGFEDWWNYLGGCYLLMDEEAMADMARSTRRKVESVEFGKMAARTRARLKRDYFAADGLVDARYRGLQCAHVFALKCGLADGEAKAKTVEALVRLIEANGNRLSTGFLGTAFLLDVLAENGRADVAYTLLLQDRCPSWLFPVTQGATTVWERWDGYTKQDGFAADSMNSFNHYAFGSVMGWLYETAAGIRPLEPGYRRFVIDPKPDPRLGSLKASFVTPQGKRLGVRWSYDAAGRCTVEKSE